jgi:uncharacterized membrane protein YphA (DoxX/SURF4 family)
MKDLVKMNPDLGLLAIRVALGAGFLAHGLQKLSGIEGVVAFFGKLGLPPFMAYVVALTETISGAAMILGMWTQLAGLAIAAIMVGAIYLVKSKANYIGGYELEFAYLLTALGLTYTGPGKHTAASMIKKSS